MAVKQGKPRNKVQAKRKTRASKPLVKSRAGAAPDSDSVINKPKKVKRQSTPLPDKDDRELLQEAALYQRQNKIGGAKFDKIASAMRVFNHIYNGTKLNAKETKYFGKGKEMEANARIYLQSLVA